MFDSQQIRSFLQHTLSGNALEGTFIFRRVKSVSFQNNTVPIYSKYTLPDEEPEIVHRSSLSREELDKSVRITCNGFRGLTDNRSLREEPSDLCNKIISFSSDKYHKFDVSNLTFELVRSEPVVPIANDLVCLFISAVSSSHSMKIPTADAWFIASDQHLRALTAIMHDRHDSLTSIIAKNTPYGEYNDRLKKKLFCGNRLMTNSWLKSKLAHEQNGVVFPREASIKAYWHLRTDNASKYWVDIWAALVLIARYGELPTCNNVPNNKGGEYQDYKRKAWHLPDGFVEQLFELCGCELPDDKKYDQTHYTDENGQLGTSSDDDKDYIIGVCKDERDETYDWVNSNVVYWPEDPDTVKEWVKNVNIQEEKKEKKKDVVEEKKCEQVPEKPKKRSVLEIALTINWSEAEGDEKY